MEFPQVKRILFATDDSKSAQYAFSYAASFAKKFDANITILHVVQEFRDMVAFDFGIERSVAAEKWFSVNNEYFQDIKNRYKDLAKHHYGEWGIDLSDVVVEKGNPVKMILQVAEEKNCDLIVIGSKGRGGLEDSMMGNTVTGVLRRSKIPVLVTRYSKDT